MPDCPPFTLNPFLSRPWPYALFLTVMMVGMVTFAIWVILDGRRHRRAMDIRAQIRDERWAERDPEGYAAVMEQRAEEEALVTARLAEYQPWWRRRRG